jgi:predicted RNase H-like HicB family nuclease
MRSDREVIKMLNIELEQEEDGRWIAEVTSLTGVMGYSQTREAAIAGVEALSLRVLADRL